MLTEIDYLKIDRCFVLYQYHCYGVAQKNTLDPKDTDKRLRKRKHNYIKTWEKPNKEKTKCMEVTGGWYVIYLPGPRETPAPGGYTTNSLAPGNIRSHSSVQRNNRMATLTRDEPKGKHVFLRLQICIINAKFSLLRRMASMDFWCINLVIISERKRQMIVCFLREKEKILYFWVSRPSVSYKKAIG